jgi:Siphovirus Gp157
VLSIAKIIRSMEADVTVLGAEVDRLQGRKRHLAGRIDWLKRYLLGEMEAVSREKVKGPTLTVSLAKAPPSCDIICAGDVPAVFQRVKVEIDRSQILDHFRQTGEVVPGTTIVVDRRYVRIS